MGKADWSLDHLERDLAAGFSLLGRSERDGGLGVGEPQALADGVLQCMNGALLKVSESLEAQNRLRRELAQAREEFRAAQVAQAERIKGLEADVAALKRALDEERGRVQTALTRLDADESPHFPPDEYLGRPLVLRSAQGDFLGVTDRSGQALSLLGFVRLVEGAGQAAGRDTCRANRVVGSCWEVRAGGWCLTLSLLGPLVRKCYVLETRYQHTPSGNKVTQLSEMRVDGVPVPQEFVVQMFRQLRESLQEE
ncbi:MAG TPA: hypothetical protein VN419_05220 [Humidesulfovibrio sp.]|uniref:hypothetical protein n=1 Tax=Humidesulfovibrio sp. TaxID=2910988 RepID=UPI002CE78E75|nr:hypothetical protein [Humidesulfovibrio sp.]HWR03401.1 hypothetical protein [Humidesulfovibrio sp.]